MNNRLKIQIACVLVALAIFPMSLLGQTAPATSTVGFPGGGVIQAGDVWESFLPAGASPSYSETGAPGLGVRFIRLGNFDRGWTTPATHWPAAYPLTPYWYKNILIPVYDPDTTFNRGPAATNPSFFAGSAAVTGGSYSNYAQLTYKSTLNGASDATRHYTLEPFFVDGTRRQHVVYEAAYPTNLGVDVKIRAHGIAAPNWNNLNDYVIVEVELKNTGFLDMDMNGAADNGKVANIIKALALTISGESYTSVSSYGGGGRNVNDIVPAIIARQASWIEDNDANGSPWAFEFVYPSATTYNPTPGSGNVDIGFNAGTNRYFTDMWHGWVMLDVKQGGLPADRSQSTGGQPSKNTIFGTHPIGTGAQRGWYMSSGSNPFAGSSGTPRETFVSAISAWYTDAGKNSHNNVFSTYNLNPNPNFFASGTTGDPTTWVPKAPGAQLRPNGDFKSSGTFEQVSFEDGKASATTNYPTGFGTWTKGASNTENFNGDNFSGVGPVSLNVGESITIAFATVAGYRLEGIQKSVRAARYAYANSFNIPRPPPLPDMKVSNTLNKSTNVEWNKVAETDAEFAGYKVWRSAQYKKLNYLDEGMRVVDLFHEQMTPGARPAALYKPVNPKFDAFAKAVTGGTKGTYQPDTWGTWDLLATIPKASLATWPAAKSAGYNYLFEDKDVILGFTYWYYVSAYKEGTYTGPDGETTTRLETHYTNRNGADGLWHLTFPFGFNNANFPKDQAGLKAIGAQQIVYSALAPRGDVSQVRVRPNPYKKTALHDNRANVYDHKLLFYNLPPQAKITILDVAGQVIDVIDFVSTDPSKGSIFWDMFSKDGIEVASGVYVYVVESPTGSQVGHFSILR
jgi:hypothetical protein